MSQNLYEILGLNASNTVTSAQIKFAYYARALIHHPDKNPNPEDAHNEMVRLNHAYTILFNEKSRIIYDEQLRYEQSSGFSATVDLPNNFARSYEQHGVKTPKRQAKRHAALLSAKQKRDEIERQKPHNPRTRVYGAEGQETKAETSAAILEAYLCSSLDRGQHHVDHLPEYTEYYDQPSEPQLKIQAKTKQNRTRGRKSIRKQRADITMPKLSADVKKFIVHGYAYEEMTTDLDCLEHLQIEQYKLESTKWSSRNRTHLTRRQIREPDHPTIADGTWEKDMAQNHFANTNRAANEKRIRAERRQRNILLEQTGLGYIVRLSKNKRKLDYAEVMVGDEFMLEVAHHRELRLMQADVALLNY